MLRVARQYVASHEIAEDVVQETWLAVYRGTSGFEGRSSLRTLDFRHHGHHREDPWSPGTPRSRRDDRGVPRWHGVGTYGRRRMADPQRGRDPLPADPRRGDLGRRTLGGHPLRDCCATRPSARRDHVARGARRRLPRRVRPFGTEHGLTNGYCFTTAAGECAESSAAMRRATGESRFLGVGVWD
ncbi:RNA polymerase sigma factor [Mycolicibacterium mucogenicum]|uniref:RNA polymerase sigma factor n=1 Tax=Mycolicibacterium mucogenicum TaxID=56689 RepID=UPI0013F4AA16|nr:sigma factor [Mycolicibacterium mucogenicum]